MSDGFSKTLLHIQIYVYIFLIVGLVVANSLIFILRIDTGAWDMIDIVVCISCSTPPRLISDTPYERSIFLLLNCIKHVNIN